MATTIPVLLSILFLSSPVFGGNVPPNDSFIRSSCTKTTYPHLCMTSLSAFASTIQNSPTQLVNTALSVSLSRAQNTSLSFSRLASMTHMSHRVSEAMQDCIENMGYSVAELRKAIAQMGQLGGNDLRLKINNVETWVSAALTEEQTCLDGFDEKDVDKNVKKEVKRCIVKLAKLTSNALSLVNSLTLP